MILSAIILPFYCMIVLGSKKKACYLPNTQ